MEPTDVRRIAFVTRRFGDLQGFRSAVGMTWGAVALWLLAHMPNRNWGLVMLGTIVIRKCVDEPLRDYYSARFGTVVPERHRVWRERVPLALAIWSAILADVKLAGAGWPSAVALVLAARAALTLARDWSFRPYLAIAVTLDVLAAVVWPLGPADLDHAALVAAIIAVADGLTGWLDHRLLRAVVKPRDLTTMAPDVPTPGAVLHLRGERYDD